MKTIGWREWIALPDISVPAIKAKIDTGARTSALHAYFVEEFMEGEELFVRFGLHPIQGKNDIERICEARVKDLRYVTDSGGHREKRYVIETTIDFGEEQWPIEITLTNRETMKFRMLLGRTAMKGRFLVDSGSSFNMGRALSSTYK